MTITIFYIFASVLLISLVSAIGIFFLFLREKTLQTTTSALLALAVGALLGGAVLHLLPEVFESKHTETAAEFVLLGIFSFFILEKVLHWHHNHKAHSIQDEKCVTCGQNLESEVKPLGKMVIFSDMLHNALDGAVVAGAFMINPMSGIAATIAVLLHEIPQEIADFGVLLHAGYSKGKAILFNFASSLTAFLGAALVIFAKDFVDKSIVLFSAFAAGSLLYIAMSDLIPELHQKHKSKELFVQFTMIALGITIMFALKAP